MKWPLGSSHSASPDLQHLRRDGFVAFLSETNAEHMLATISRHLHDPAANQKSLVSCRLQPFGLNGQGFDSARSARCGSDWELDVFKCSLAKFELSWTRDNKEMHLRSLGGRNRLI